VFPVEAMEIRISERWCGGLGRLIAQTLFLLAVGAPVAFGAPYTRDERSGETLKRSLDERGRRIMGLYARGEYGEARGLFRQSLDPFQAGATDRVVGEWAVKTVAETGDPSEVVILARVALEYVNEDSDHPGCLYHLLGRGYAAVGRPVPALRAYQQGMRLSGTEDATYLRLATDLARLTPQAWPKRREADVLAESLAQRPSLLHKEAVLFHLARVNQEAGNLSRFREYSRLLSERYPDGNYTRILIGKGSITATKSQSGARETAEVK
jgi:hypothetical protein